jgi:dihydrofolate reductase
MRTVVWATLTANGNYARASAAHPPTQQALEDFAAQAKRAGNFIVGRRTFEGFQSDSSRRAAGADNTFAGTDIVLVSGARLEAPGVVSTSSPADALAHLERKGHDTALVAGGATLINAFLAQGLVDELVVNIVPALESQGLKLHLPDEQYADLTLLESSELGGGVGQRRYALNRTAA